MATGTAASRTYETTDPTLNRYLDMIGKVPLLTVDDEARLGAAVADGMDARVRLAAGVHPDDADALRATIAAGNVARSSMIRANLRLVVSLVRRFGTRQVPMLDLIQEGNIGLMRAVEKFDYRRGFKFSTYATWWIRQAISRAIPEHRPIRVPSQSYELLLRCRQVRDEIEQRTGTRCGIPAIAEELGASVRRVRDLMHADAPPVAIESDDDVVVNLAAADDPSAAVHNEDVRCQVASALTDLSVEQAAVVRLRYGFDGEPCSLVETAARLGASKASVQRLERAALDRLRATRTVVALALPESA